MPAPLRVLRGAHAADTVVSMPVDLADRRAEVASDLGILRSAIRRSRASIKFSIQRVISTSTHALAPPNFTGAGNFPALMSS